METEIIRELIRQGILGIVCLAEGLAIWHLYKELVASWKDRANIADQRFQAYYELCSEILSLRSLSYMIEENNVQQRGKT